MTQQPSAYPAPPPRPLPPAKPRPRALWFLGPVLLMVLGAALAIGAGVFFAKTLGATDDEVPLDGKPHNVSLSDSEDRLVWRATGSPVPTCTYLDDATGSELEWSTPSASYTRSFKGPEYSGFLVVAPTSDAMVVTCAAEDAPPLQIGKKPDTGSTFGGFFGGLFGGLALGGVGLIWLIVLLVVFLTRPKRAA